MVKNTKQICREIRNGIQVEENIQNLFHYLADDYHNYAGLRLAMHYFAFYEAYSDNEETWSKDALETTNRVNQIIDGYILKNKNGEELEKAINDIVLIRNDIIKRMDVLTAFTDVFQTYEYVLNRLEYRYYKSLEPVNNDELARDILRYIFDTEDNLVINTKIQSMIGQLPIRITKQKYFELIWKSLNAYLGSEVSSLESYLYMLRTSSMLYYKKEMESFYPGLWETKETLSKISFKDLSKEDFDKTQNKIRAVAAFLENEATVYYELEEIVNEIYSMLLCQPYTGKESEKVEILNEAATSVLAGVNEYFLNKEKKELPEDLILQLSKMEGVQEEMFIRISVMEDAFNDANLNYRPLVLSQMPESAITALKYAGNLLSNSLFIHLEEEIAEEEIVDEDKVELEYKALKEELTALFDKYDRRVGRAVMANTISNMPVFFADHKEVMDYVKYSLERCTDEFEKAGCIEIIMDLMS